MFANLMAKKARRGTGAANAKVHTLPAPVGGWNARDSLSAMKPEDAIILDNIIPDQGRVRLRNGFAAFATGIPGSYVETLLEYAPPSSASYKLFAAGPSAIYDVSSAGAVGAAAVSGMANGRWKSVMMATIGGNFLCAVNGANGYRTYDGGTWTNQDAAVTGITGGNADTTELIDINLHANRLWFVQKNSLDAWYLGTASIIGAVTKFPLGPLCKLGGQLLTIATWTKDAGDGMDDLIVFVTTKGEVIVYAGTNPADAASWSLVGVFRISEPIGRRCTIKVGGDLGIITSTGVALLSTLIGTNLSGQRKAAITNKISRAFVDVYKTCGDNYGWQIQEFPSQNLVLVNVPVVERQTSHQYVINIETGSWCRFTGINALCWSLKGDQLFFGGADGKVYQFGEELDDNGAAIIGHLQMAYNTCGGNNNKVFKLLRALLVTAQGYQPGVALAFNYDTSPPQPAFVTAEATGSPWDISAWDVADWGISTEEVGNWQTVSGVGRSVSVALGVSSKGVPFEFNQVDLMLEDASWL